MGFSAGNPRGRARPGLSISKLARAALVADDSDLVRLVGWLRRGLPPLGCVRRSS
jgi:hypothetical protein